MRCGWVQERLLLYLARELGAPEAEQVRAHLQKLRPLPRRSGGT